MCQHIALEFCTFCIDDVIVVMTSKVVRVTIILSVKSSSSKWNERYPTRMSVKVCPIVLYRWYSICRLKMIITSAVLTLLIELTCRTSPMILYSTSLLPPASRASLPNMPT